MRSRRGAAWLHPFWSHSWIAFTCAPSADSVLTSGGQSRGSGHDSTVPIHCLRKINPKPMAMNVMTKAYTLIHLHDIIWGKKKKKDNAFYEICYTLISFHWIRPLKETHKLLLYKLLPHSSKLWRRISFYKTAVRTLTVSKCSSAWFYPITLWQKQNNELNLAF